MCDERERLIGYVYDEVDAEERRQIKRHLESCDVCREEIGGLRQVREDLLAWDVPEYESVWKPFAPARATPWWREVPGWALAAAATLTFAVGAAGGAATQAVFGAPVEMAQAAVPAVQATPVSISDAQVAEIEQRLLSRMRAAMDTELASRPANSPQPMTLPTNLVTYADMEAAFMSLSSGIDAAHERVEKVETKMRGVETTLALNGTQGPGHN